MREKREKSERECPHEREKEREVKRGRERVNANYV